MDDNLDQIKINVFDNCGLIISNFQMEMESTEYGACRFNLSGRKIICRNSKITPKKVGQFVTFWKRNSNGNIGPLDDKDLFDFYIVNVKTKTEFGQFIFPKSILIEKGIISTDTKEGKRAFRVYPTWDIPDNKQAERSQKWQLDYFYEINDSLDLKRAEELYKAFIPTHSGVGIP